MCVVCWGCGVRGTKVEGGGWGEVRLGRFPWHTVFVRPVVYTVMLTALSPPTPCSLSPRFVYVYKPALPASPLAYFLTPCYHVAVAVRPTRITASPPPNEPHPTSAAKLTGKTRRGAVCQPGGTGPFRRTGGRDRPPAGRARGPRSRPRDRPGRRASGTR